MVIREGDQVMFCSYARHRRDDEELETGDILVVAGVSRAGELACYPIDCDGQPLGLICTLLPAEIIRLVYAPAVDPFCEIEWDYEA
jgi:hypothetical protein